MLAGMILATATIMKKNLSFHKFCIVFVVTLFRAYYKVIWISIYWPVTTASLP